MIESQIKHEVKNKSECIVVQILISLCSKSILHAIPSLQQLTMSSLLSNSTILEDEYAVAIDYGAESMCDANCCPALADFGQAILDAALRLCVERTTGLV